MEEDLGKHIIRTFNLEEKDYTYTYKKLGYEFYIHTAFQVREEALEKIIDNYYETKKMFKIKTNSLKYINSENTETVNVTKISDMYKLRVINIKNRLN